ncbi:MAG: NAD(P) transhydrogenase subunit alpha [Cryomorphaceae bacterium]
MKRIGFISEPIENPRLCVSPSTVEKLLRKFAVEVYVERKIGSGLGINDSEFTEAGAKVVSREDVLHECDLLSFVEPPEVDLQALNNKVLIGMMNPLDPTVSMDDFLYKNISVFSIDLVPRTSRAQTMDVRSSLSSLAGYRAVIKSADIFGSVFPMMSSAAGTLKPARVLVLGAGVAGLQAIATAKRLGAIVEAFDVRIAAKEQVESLGAKFIRVESATEDASAGGYAIEQTDEYKLRQQAVLAERIKGADIVICTANVPGKKAPVLISTDHVETMASGSVIVDIASVNGGNCELTQDGRMVMHNGVSILGAGHITKEGAVAASRLLAENYYSFLEYFIVNHEIATDEIIKSCKLIERGNPVHSMFKKTEQWKVLA